MTESEESPRSLIVTVYGLYARERDGVLPVAGLVRLLARLSVDSQAVRAAVSRLKRRGMLTATRVDGAAGYALTPVGHSLLAEGDTRIFHPPRPDTSDWVLCVFSIPETQRSRRHVLRSKLTWLGFGQAAGGVWIAPSHALEPTRATLRRHGLLEYVSLFRADYLGEQTPETVAGWWDLPRLADMYRRFLRRHAADASHTDPLAGWIRAVDDWRRLPFLDPGLPPRLLPADWPGHRAEELFHELEHALAKPAARQAHELLSSPGSASPPPTET